MLDTTIISLVSVIVTGIMAVAGHFIPLWNDQRRVKHETQKEVIASLQKASTDVLERLAHFEGDSALPESDDSAYVELRGKLYAWQTLVDLRLPGIVRVRVTELVEDARAVKEQREIVPYIAQNIVDLTELAIDAAEAQ